MYDVQDFSTYVQHSMTVCELVRSIDELGLPNWQALQQLRSCSRDMDMFP